MSLLNFIFLILLLIVTTKREKFSPYNYGNCCECCDCTDSENFDFNKDICSDEITKDNKKITQKILEHLNLETWEKLKNIAAEIKGIKEGGKKLQKVLNITKDINWNSKCYPNTIIKWENNKCQYVAYFHLMLNNPYFLKFFLLCSELIKGGGTVLYEVCKLVKQCILNPRFDINYKCSTDDIMQQFFSNVSYENQRKNLKEIANLSKNFLLTGNYNSSINYESINTALYKDLEDLFCLKNFDLGTHTFEEYIFDLKGDNFEILSTEEITNLLKNENNSLIGIKITIENSHTYAIIRNKGKWYIKDTYQDCKEITIEEILKLISEGKTINRKSSYVYSLMEYKQENWEIGNE